MLGCQLLVLECYKSRRGSPMPCCVTAIVFFVGGGMI